ncbi:chromate transporter [Anaerovoracaceae bacterium 41-7]|uniref:chromate transporter n=1 Tax=Emergencia sp. 1XD21-10 TaxID=2304569 RepID=UPI0013797080|nr:chromate transporter [Emergencia sp. 1XD21-10]MCI9640850.1 chromate transporter [Emergencia sp.]NCF00362.1 chromate transporter [Emergencia sp. 1XD21-10]
MGKTSGVKENIYFQLFWSFFKLGLFTIGGGMAMIPLIQGIVVDEKHWMTEEEAVDCIAVSQGLPGVVAINMATYIGHQKKGIGGALAATIGVILPSFIIIIAIVKLLQGIGDNPYVQGALVGIKAAATGLIAFSAYKVGKQVLKKPFQWILALASFGLIAGLSVSAVWAIVGGIAAGLVYTAVMEKRKNRDGGERV